MINRKSEDCELLNSKAITLGGTPYSIFTPQFLLKGPIIYAKPSSAKWLKLIGIEESLVALENRSQTIRTNVTAVHCTFPSSRHGPCLALCFPTLLLSPHPKHIFIGV